MLNERIVRERHRQVRESLDKLDQERVALEDMLRADERWLQLHGAAEDPPQLPLTTNAPVASKSKAGESGFGAPLGSMSQKAAVLAVLKGGNGRAMHVREIWAAAERLGAKSKAKSPLGSVDWVITNLIAEEEAPIVRKDPRVYAWATSQDHATPNST